MMPALRAERGQAAVLTILFMIVLIGMAAMVLDVGAWYRADRQTQATADAAALAGAQDLPDSTSAATASALDYADRNDGGVEAGDVEFGSSLDGRGTDTIKVTAHRPVAGIFTRLFGIDSVNARSSAKARVGAMDRAKWAAPIGVDYRHPDLRCTPTLECDPRFDTPTEIDFFKVGPGAFRLINIDSSRGGTSPQTLGDWIRSGLDGYMDRNKWYYSDPGMKPDSSHIKDALNSRLGVGKEILLPVYDATRAQGAGFDYHVVGWVGFVVTGWDIRGSKQATIQGYFTEIIWDGIQSEDGSQESFGARAIHLIE